MLPDQKMTIPVPPPTSATSICARCRTLQETYPWEPASIEVEAVLLGQSDCEVCQIFWNCFKYYFSEYDCLSSMKVAIDVRLRELTMLPLLPDDHGEVVVQQHGLCPIVLNNCLGNLPHERKTIYGQARLTIISSRSPMSLVDLPKPRLHSHQYRSAQI